MGSSFPVTVRSDHKNLPYFRTAQKLNRRQARWSLYLSEFDLNLIHIPGTQMVQSDALSRRADLAPDMDDNNDDQTLLPDSLFVNMIDTKLNDLIRKTERTDPVVHSALAALLEGGPFPMKSSLKDWHTTNELVFYKNQCYVPDDLFLRCNKNITTLYLRDTPDALPPRSLSSGITGGQVWPHSSEITSTAVLYASNTRSTATLSALHSSRLPQKNNDRSP